MVAVDWVTVQWVRTFLNKASEPSISVSSTESHVAMDSFQGFRALPGLAVSYIYRGCSPASKYLILLVDVFEVTVIKVCDIHAGAATFGNVSNLHHGDL